MVLFDRSYTTFSAVFYLWLWLFPLSFIISKIVPVISVQKVDLCRLPITIPQLQPPHLASYFTDCRCQQDIGQILTIFPTSPSFNAPMRVTFWNIATLVVVQKLHSDGAIGWLKRLGNMFSHWELQTQLTSATYNHHTHVNGHFQMDLHQPVPPLFSSSTQDSYGLDTVLVIQPTLTNHWSELKTHTQPQQITPTGHILSSPISWWKGLLLLPLCYWCHYYTATDWWDYDSICHTGIQCTMQYNY